MNATWERVPFLYDLSRRSYGNANYRPEQHGHYSCSVIRDT